MAWSKPVLDGDVYGWYVYRLRDNAMQYWWRGRWQHELEQYALRSGALRALKQAKGKPRKEGVV